MLPALFSVALPATLLTCNSTTVLKWLQRHRLQFALFTVVVACPESFVVDLFQQVAQHHLLAATARWVVVAHADFSSRLAQVLSENIQVGFMVLDNRQRVVPLRNELMDDDSIKFVEVCKDNTGVMNCIFEDDLTWSGKVNTAAEINTVNNDDQHLIPKLDLCCHAIHKFNKRAKLYFSSTNFHESQEKHKPTYQLSELRKKNKPTLCLDRVKASGLKGFACNRGYQNPMKDSTHLYQDPQWNGCCMSGRHLRVACNNGHIYMERRLDENNKEYYSGVDADIIKIIATKLNFSFEIFRARDQQYGNLEENGSITGIIGEVAHHRAHVGADQLTITRNRIQVVEFTSPYFFEPTVIVSKAAAPNAVIWTMYRPFTAAAWLSVLLLVLVIGPVAAGLARLSSTRHSSTRHSSTRHSSSRHPSTRHSSTRHSSTRHSSTLYCKTGPASPSYGNQRPPGIAYYTFGLLRSLLLQGNTLPVRGLPLCIFIGGCYFSFIVIQTSYCGALTAVIAAPSYERPIDSLEDLLESHYRKGTKLVQLPGNSFDNQIKLMTKSEYVLSKDYYKQDVHRHVADYGSGGQFTKLSLPPSVTVRTLSCIFNVPASCLPSPKPAPRPAKVEDQQLRYFLQKDKITSFDAFKPKRNLQKQYKNLIISRSKERVVCLFINGYFSECSLFVIVENKPTLCSPQTFTAFKNGISVPLFKTLHPNNGLKSYPQFDETVRLAMHYEIPFDKTIQNVVTLLQAHTSACVHTEKEKKLLFLSHQLGLLLHK
ncbi:Ionotropic glutamate receptor L-glutamate and glycine-binding domain [Trinorchestia longiramus]|nr:Ionotropic glutamate receptor L-glutamate and glycine-binding domain [Trinorchestia longiramus]